MDKKSKILIWVVVVLIIGSVGATYWRIFVEKDYIISNEVDCDPYSEACFIWECDPASTVEGEACTNDPEVDIWYYKIAERKAANIPLCDPNEDETCLPFQCEEDEEGCSETLCEEGNADEIACVDPVQFTIDNPIEEESACEEGDEECLAEEEAAAEECAQDDAECLAASEAEMESELEVETEVCAEDDQTCLEVAEKAALSECAPDDAECLAGTQAEEPAEDETATPEAQ